MQDKEIGNAGPARNGYARNRVLTFPALEPAVDGMVGGPGAGSTLGHLRPEAEWSHTIESARIIGGQSIVICSLVIRGQKRDGIGSCESRNPDSFRIAEERALANAACKFPASVSSAPSAASVVAGNRAQASSLANLVSGSQLRRLKMLEKSSGFDVNEESDRLFGCCAGELSREAAFILIENLESRADKRDEMKLAG